VRCRVRIPSRSKILRRHPQSVCSLFATNEAAWCGLHKRKETTSWAYLWIIKATDTGYTGTVKTLTHKITADFTRVLDRTNGNAPAYEIYSDLRIGAVWDRTGKSGKYLLVSLENRAFPRATTACTATVVSRMAARWCSSVRAPRRRRRHQSSRLRKAEGPGKLGPSCSCRPNRSPSIKCEGSHQVCTWLAPLTTKGGRDGIARTVALPSLLGVSFPLSAMECGRDSPGTPDR